MSFLVLLLALLLEKFSGWRQRIQQRLTAFEAGEVEREDLPQPRLEVRA